MFTLLALSRRCQLAKSTATRKFESPYAELEALKEMSRVSERARLNPDHSLVGDLRTRDVRVSPDADACLLVVGVSDDVLHAGHDGGGAQEEGGHGRHPPRHHHRLPRREAPQIIHHTCNSRVTTHPPSHRAPSDPVALRLLLLLPPLPAAEQQGLGAGACRRARPRTLPTSGQRQSGAATAAAGAAGQCRAGAGRTGSSRYTSGSQ